MAKRTKRPVQPVWTYPPTARDRRILEKTAEMTRDLIDLLGKDESLSPEARAAGLYGVTKEEYES